MATLSMGTIVEDEEAPTNAPGRYDSKSNARRSEFVKIVQYFHGSRSGAGFLK